MRAAVTVLVAISTLCISCALATRPIVLEGTVVTPSVVLSHGWVVVDGDRIRSVSASPPRIPGAVTLNTNGLIFPGLIDLHNHVAWNVFPRWSPVEPYNNHDEWQEAPTYRAAVATPGQVLLRRHACDMNRYGEIRALIGGVTSIQSSPRMRCIRGLVRNLDYYSDFYPERGFGREPSRLVLDITSLSDDARRSIVGRLRGDRLRALFVHLAEGRPGDPRAKREFALLMRDRLLGRKTVIVHGSALGDREFRAMQAAGAGLVWSPRSNMTLYGETTNIAAALDRDIPVALAPDWAITGSSNMLDELAFAARFNEVRLGSRLTENQLVEMVTEVPARMAAIDDKVGAVREGLYADLLVIEGDRTRPYHALVTARPQDVRLVLIGGQPVYGALAVMKQLGTRRSPDDLSVCGTAMAIDMHSGDDSFLRSKGRFAALEGRLRIALAAVRPDTKLSPLADCR